MTVTTTAPTESLSVSVPISGGELASAVYDNLWRNISPWIVETTWSWQNPTNMVTVVGDNPDGGSALTRIISTEDLAVALGQLIQVRQHHCGMPISLDDNDWDSCVSDMILQQACYGEVVFG
jgi:hypothetical protein